MIKSLYNVMCLQENEANLIEAGTMHRHHSRYIPRYKKFTDLVSTDEETLIEQTSPRNSVLASTEDNETFEPPVPQNQSIISEKSVMAVTL